MPAYKDLKPVEGDNVPGLKKKVYVISKKDITAYPTLPQDSVELVGNFTLAASAKFSCIEAVQKEVKLTSDPQGEKESRTVLNKLTLRHAYVTSDIQQFQRIANKDDLIFLVEDMEGRFLCIGNPEFETDSKIKIDLGAEVTSKKGVSIEAQCSDMCLRVYKGTITTSDGDINPPPGEPAKQ